MLNLFNRLLSKGEYPICFREGVISPFFKKRRYRRCEKLSRINVNKYTFKSLFSDHIKQIN